MEMDNQAFHQIMSTQNQMLQQLVQMQQENKMSNMQEQQGPAFAQPPQSFGPQDPTAYASYGAPYAGGNRPMEQGPAGSGLFGNQGFIGSTMDNMRNFEGTRQSKEASNQFFGEQMRGFQEGVSNMITGGAATGGAAASMFVPGLLPSLAIGGGVALGVGATASGFQGGFTHSLDYQSMMQREPHRFVNAFQSTDDMGGIGMGLDDRQDISRFARNLGADEFMNQDEIKQIMDSSMDFNLLRTVEDVEGFEKKFSEIVDTVKNITVSLNKTIEEAAEFMGEMERRGIATKDMSFIASQAKVAGSMVGMDGGEMMQVLAPTSDAITRGTQLDAADVMSGTAMNVYGVQLLEDNARAIGDDATANYIMNNGGAAQVGANMTADARNFMGSQSGQDMIKRFFGSGFAQGEDGGFQVDEERMRDLIEGNVSLREMTETSQNFMRNMPVEDRAEFDKVAGMEFENWASEQDVMTTMGRYGDLLVEHQAEQGRDISRSVAFQEVGVARTPQDAKMLDEMLSMYDDPSVQQDFTAMSFREEIDANMIANSPTLWQRGKYAIERNFTNRLGNAGQNVSDVLGQVGQDYQQFITGVGDRSQIGDSDLAGYDQQSFEDFTREVFTTVNETNETMREHYQIFGEGQEKFTRDDIARSSRQNDYVDEIDIDEVLENMEEFEPEQMNAKLYSYYKDRAKAGQLTAQEMDDLRQMRDDVGVKDGHRIDRILNEATGAFDEDGGGGWLARGLNSGGLALYSAGESAWQGVKNVGNWAKDYTQDHFMPWVDQDSGDLGLGDLDQDMEEMQQVRQDLTNELSDLMGTDAARDLDDEDRRKLEQYIRSGNTEQARAILDSSAVGDLSSGFVQVRDLEKELGEKHDSLMDYNRYVGAMAQSPERLAGLLKSTDILGSDSMIDDLLGDAMKAGEGVLEDIEEGTLSPEDASEAFTKMDTHIDEAFNNLGYHKMYELAEELSAQDINRNIESFYLEGTEDIDTEELKRYVREDVLRQPGSQWSSDEEGEDGEVTEALSDHEGAVYELLNSIQNEIGMINDYMDGAPIREPSGSVTN